MYGGAQIGTTMVPTVLVGGRRSSRVLSARWSGVLDEAPLAVLALDRYPHGKIYLMKDLYKRTV